MTADTNPDAAYASSLQFGWDTVRAAVFTRDSYTCQRCGYTPSESSDHRVLHAHRLLTGRAESVAPSAITSRHITLCRPCHGIQHPTDAIFDACRPTAPLVPSYRAHPDVALTNPAHPDYTPIDEAIWMRHRTFDRDEYICQRCYEHGVSPHSSMAGPKLTAYVVDRPLTYGFAGVRHMLSLCRSCYWLVAGEAEKADVGREDSLLPHKDAHPEVAAPRPPETPDEEERVREFLVEFCLERDSHTCNRCATHIDVHSEDYPYSSASIYTPHDDGSESFNPADYILLCSPCYAVLQPHESETQEFLLDAQRKPDDTAHPWADVEKTYYRPRDLQTMGEQTLQGIFDQYSHQCQRCTSRRLDEDDLVAFPTFDVTSDVVEQPFDQYIALCRPCASVVHHNGPSDESIDDLHAIDALDDASFADAAAGAKPTPTYPIMHGIVDVERSPVNRKERLLLDSWLRGPHMLWKLGGTVSIATALFFVMLTNLLWIDRSMVSLPLTGWTATPWLVITGLLVLTALGVASTIRWTVADLTGRLWALVDSTIESHHHRVDAPHEWKQTLIAYAYLFGLPYVAVAVGQILFLTLLTIHWALTGLIG